MTPSGTVFWELSDDCDGKVGKVTFEWYKDGEDGEIVVQEEVIAPTNTWYQLPVSKLEDGAKYILLVSSYVQCFNTVPESQEATLYTNY